VQFIYTFVASHQDQGDFMRLSLTAFIVIAMVFGTAVGMSCHEWVRSPSALGLITGTCDLFSTVFLRAIKMIIAPLVLCTLVSGVARMGQSGALGRMAARSMAWFMLASLVALGVSFAVVQLLAPGRGLDLKAQATASGLKAPPLTVSGFIGHMVPTSIFDAMAQNEILQIVIFALVAGIAMGRLGEVGERLTTLSEDVSHLMLRMTTYVMMLAPIAVFAAMTKALAQQGVGVIATYGAYIAGFYLALAAFWVLMLAAGAAVLGFPQQFRLLKAIRQPTLIALTTTSSEAAYPILLRQLEAFGVPNRIASFVLPLGYSFNLVGAMVYCTYAAMFIVQAYDVHLSGAQITELLMLLFVTSKGIASIPRAALLIVASTISYFNIPEVGILLILGVDHFLDMGRTATNTVGNALAAASVAKWERPS